MKVISIGTDRKIFEEGSAVRARIVEYGSLFSELHIIIFAQKSLGLKAQQISSNVWVYPTSSSSKFLYIRDGFKKGCEIISTFEHCRDVVVSVQDPFETGRVGLKLKKKYSLPLQVQIHTDLFSPYFAQESLLNRIRLWNAKKVLPAAHEIRVVSKKIKDSLKAKIGIDQEKIDVLPIFVEEHSQAAIATKKYSQFSSTILMVGRLAHEKNIPFAIDVFAEVLKTHPTIGLVIVGEGSEKKTLTEQVNRLGISKSVILEPWQQDLGPFYQSADIFLHTSLYEGYGLVLVGAGMYGLPILTSDVGIAGEILKDTVNASIAPVSDKAQFVTKLIVLLDNSELRQQYKQRVAADVAQAIITDKQTYLKSYKQLHAKAQEIKLHRSLRPLIITQKVDSNDANLGFFTEWINEFSKHCTEVNVICLEKGRYMLNDNVKVFSLGKENKRSRLVYIFKFYSYIWNLRKQYNAVFVHMNPEYAVLGGLFWKLWGKNTALWYTHKSVHVKLRIATHLVKRVFTASKESFRLPTKKLIVTGHGIDTIRFSPQPQHQDPTYTIVSAGRISKSKNIHLLIESAAQLHSRHVQFKLRIAGEPITVEDKKYFDQIKLKIVTYNLGDQVQFIGQLSNAEMVTLYNSSHVFVNLSDTGSLDKAVLEAMSCGIHVLTSNEAFVSMLDEAHRTSKDPAEITKKLMAFPQLPVDSKLRQHIVIEHNLSILIRHIIEHYSNETSR
ncbi:MAG: glycosyltransferase [bacterium]|nr:glycosyltransferase [bacterium]